MPKKTKASPSQEFEEKKALIDLELKASKIQHKLKMEELAYQRESDRLYHERELERGRIKNAEIRKNLALKDNMWRHKTR
jgi:hypothetical protein